MAFTYYICIYGGIIKNGNIVIHRINNKPEEEFNKFTQIYSTRVRGRYVKVSDDEDYMTEIKEKLNEHIISDNIYELSIESAIKTIKEITSAKQASFIDTSILEKAKDKDDDSKKKSKKKPSKKKDSSDEESEKESDNDSDSDKKKKSKKKATKKKSEAAAAASDDDDKKKKNKSGKKKPSKKKESSDEDSDESTIEISDSE